MENKKLRILLIIAGLALALSLVWHGADRSSASAPQGYATVMSTSSTRQVGRSNSMTLTATSTGCTSRVVSTSRDAVLLSFDALASTTLSLDMSRGHWQGASTTVAYDSGLYGCGGITAWGYDATSTVTISVFEGFR